MMRFICDDCKTLVEGREPWEVDGRHICTKCCARDSRKFINVLDQYHKQRERLIVGFAILSIAVVSALILWGIT